MTVAIRPAGADDLSDIRALFRAYVDWLLEAHGLDACLQGFEAELAALPGGYSPPRGALLIARAADGRAVGCGAFRPLEATTCEMKRLFVVPEARGQALGRRLVADLIDAARAAGHRRMVLDTGAGMLPAQRLYEGFGFVSVPQYADSALTGICFMGLDL